VFAFSYSYDLPLFHYQPDQWSKFFQNLSSRFLMKFEELRGNEKIHCLLSFMRLLFGRFQLSGNFRIIKLMKLAFMKVQRHWCYFLHLPSKSISFSCLKDRTTLCSKFRKMKGRLKDDCFKVVSVSKKCHKLQECTNLEDFLTWHRSLCRFYPNQSDRMQSRKL